MPGSLGTDTFVRGQAIAVLKHESPSRSSITHRLNGAFTVGPWARALPPFAGVLLGLAQLFKSLHTRSAGPAGEELLEMFIGIRPPKSGTLYLFASFQVPKWSSAAAFPKCA